MKKEVELNRKLDITSSLISYDQDTLYGSRYDTLPSLHTNISTSEKHTRANGLCIDLAQPKYLEAGHVMASFDISAMLSALRKSKT
jgi:hypothetical protein